MNAVVLWVFLPLLISSLLFVIQARKTWVTLLGAGFSALLALSVGILPVERAVRIGPWTVQLVGQFSIFGRQILITQSDRPFLMLLFLVTAFWILGSLVVDLPAYFGSLSLTVTTLIILGVSIQPIYYAALLFGFVALLMVIILSAPGSRPTPGVLRFLSFQTLGVLLILFSGWLLGWIDVQSVDLTLLVRSLILMGLGLAFLLGIFPFSTWVTMLARQNHPYLVAFVFTMFVNGVLLFTYEFFEEYGWIQEYINLERPLQVVGALMIGMGAIWAAFQNDLGRLMGAAMITEVGRSVLTLGLNQLNLEIFISAFLIQVLTFGIWGMGLSYLKKQTHSLDFKDIRGTLPEIPFIAGGILVAHFSLAGLPLLGSFPLYWLFESVLINQGVLWVGVWFFLGSVGLFLGGLRALGVMALASSESGSYAGSVLVQKILLSLGVGGLILTGLFFNSWLRFLREMLGRFLSA